MSVKIVYIVRCINDYDYAPDQPTSFYIDSVWDDEQMAEAHAEIVGGSVTEHIIRKD